MLLVRGPVPRRHREAGFHVVCACGIQVRVDRGRAMGISISGRPHVPCTVNVYSSCRYSSSRKRMGEGGGTGNPPPTHHQSRSKRVRPCIVLDQYKNTTCHRELVDAAFASAASVSRDSLAHQPKAHSNPLVLKKGRGTRRQVNKLISNKLLCPHSSRSTVRQSPRAR